MAPIFSERLLKFLSRGIFLGLVLAFIIVCFQSNGNNTISNGRVGGDFPAFYGAAKIIDSGDWQNLYDMETQRRAQQGLFPEREATSHLIFAYPPYLALILSPLATLSFISAYALYTVLMLFFLLFACKYLKRLLPSLPLESTELMMIACCAYPFFRAIPGGQSTSLSLLCLLGAGYHLKSGKPIYSGVFLGIWLFKAQFALPALLLFLSTGQFAILLGFIPIALVFYFMGVVIGGWHWITWWLQSAVKPFVELDRLVNLHNFITIRSFIERLLGNDSASYLPISLIISTLLFCALFIFWRKHFGNAAFACLALTSTLLLLIAPHALFYDAGLALIAALYLSLGQRLYWPLIIVIASWFDILSPYLPIQPTFILLCLLSFFVWRNQIRITNRHVT